MDDKELEKLKPKLPSTNKRFLQNTLFSTLSDRTRIRKNKELKRKREETQLRYESSASSSEDGSSSRDSMKGKHSKRKYDGEDAHGYSKRVENCASDNRDNVNDDMNEHCWNSSRHDKNNKKHKHKKRHKSHKKHRHKRSKSSSQRPRKHKRGSSSQS
ncbi:protein FAM133-like isoform X2 [Ptychodera flava]|uniref:protein FAM133-like isoform X2 n=1 Tax=Ptychodera flava TaxID=63121 RepID=UPI00396A5486